VVVPEGVTTTEVTVEVVEELVETPWDVDGEEPAGVVLEEEAGDPGVVLTEEAGVPGVVLTEDAGAPGVVVVPVGTLAVGLVTTPTDVEVVEVFVVLVSVMGQTVVERISVTVVTTVE
jgi:hypothetical protein